MMSLIRLLSVVLGALALCAMPRAAAAQNQVKPYFLVVFDTSGSMGDDVRTPTNSANSCNYGGNDPSKLDEAKCAFGKLLNATGDAEFGLMQFASGNGNTECGSSGASCSPVASSAWLRVPIQTNSAVPISRLIDNSGTAPADELCSGSYTPLGGALIAAKDYYRGSLSGFSAPTVGDTGLACRPLSVILLTDGEECCASCNTGWAGVGCPTAGAALGISCSAMCIDTDTCNFNPNAGFESAPEHAYELLTGFSDDNVMRRGTLVPSASGPTRKPIQTYVIAFGLNPGASGNPRIERIAIAGGTDNPVDGSGGLRAFYAQDETALALAFSQIIADSQPPTEICNNLDDDCDTLIDEGIPKYCDIPNGITEKTLCDEPDETNCDGIDDDCDGIIDEGTFNACGACGDEIPAEVCDGFDNDCDGEIDEETGGGACGRDEGECKSGELVCVDGVLECRGAVGPSPEVCNGLDDDCDGMIDEDPRGDLCPDGRCVAGMCVPFCADTEFSKACNLGRRPERQPNGECLCIIDECDQEACAESTIERAGNVVCAPDVDGVAACLCRGGACTFACDNVTCRSGEVCDPRRGLCVVDDCRGLGCDEGFICDAFAKECVEDACATADCDDGQVCRRGACERSCADLRCPSGQSCRGGRCVDDPCSLLQCVEGTYCDASSRSCEDDPCASVGCGLGLVCSSENGECERDPCFGVRCPSGQACGRGECARLSGGGDGPIQPGNPTRVLATGGGGCACSAVGAGSEQARTTGLALPFGLMLLGFALARARRRFGARARSGAASAAGRALLVAAVLVLGSALSSGCEVSPFCVNCVDPGSNQGGNGGLGGSGGLSGNGGGSGAGTGGAAGNAGSGGAAGDDPDGGPDRDGCTPVFETCNGEDDDCDGRVDERVEADANTCEQRGICAGSAPACVAGEFKCQYPAEREADETLCDGEDNDCDGRVDEAFPTLGDACSLGVGQCATPGTLQCNGAGTGVVCVIGTPIEPSEEVCDGIDNDCDGLADEPASDPGTNPSFVRDDLVQIASSVWMYKYEASRPDATDDAQGIIGERACSKAGVLPWTNVTYTEAVEACEAAGLTLCTEAQWFDGCNGQSNNCAFSYAPSGTCAAYPSNGMNACNGHDLNAAAGSPDTDALAPTGAFANCFSPQMSGGQVFDLSGNAKEWVTDSPNFPATGDTLPSGSNPTRGGSYNNLPGGMRCDFSFSAANNGVRLRNLGFRCCTTTAPP